MPPTQQPPAPPPLPPIVFFYTCVIQLALPAITAYLYADKSAPMLGLTPDALRPAALGPEEFAYYAAALVCIVLALTVPRTIARHQRGALTRTPQTRALVPYMVRLTLFELVTLVGFVMSIRAHAPFLIVPFAAVGIALTLLSPPTPSLLQRLSG